MTFVMYEPAFCISSDVKVIVIDAGHGGHDSGAVGKYTLEKDVNLSVALLLGEKIKDRHPEVKVVYTRKTDVFVELYNRSKIANNNKADLFISIHCNSSQKSGPQGAETFVMGVNKSNQNLEIVKKENAAILLEDNYSANYDGFDPNSPESHIMFSFYQGIHLDQSLKIAKAVQENIINDFKLVDRGVKQAGLMVLWASAMPGILVELAFINNPEEEKILNSKKNHDKYAESIYNAFLEYKTGEKSIITAINLKKDSDKTLAENIDKIDDDKTVVKQEKIDSKSNDDTITYRVQFLISKTKIQLSDIRFRDIHKVNSYLHNGMYKYTSGDETSQEKADEIRKKLCKKGYNDAFIIKFKNGNRL